MKRSPLYSILNGSALALFCAILGSSGSVSITASSHGLGCNCPEASTGWTIYPDSARGAPDFYDKTYVQVGEVLLCDGAAHVMFSTRQGNRKSRVCVVVAEPTFDQFIRHLPPDSIPGDADLEEIQAQLEFERTLFAERMRRLREVLECSAHGNQNANFGTGLFRRPPRLYPGSPLVVRWKDRRVELTGSVDVFFAGAGQ